MVKATKKMPRNDKSQPAALLATINLHKRLHGVTFKRKAPRAVKEIKKFASKIMGTSVVRVHDRLNQKVWSKGVRNVPYRIRVKMTRKRNDDENAAEKMYTLVEWESSAVDLKGLKTVKAEETA
jgi:large subunit ribosomal protein L31e